MPTPLVDRRTRRHPRLVAVLVACGLVVAACSGGSTGEATPASTQADTVPPTSGSVAPPPSTVATTAPVTSTTTTPSSTTTTTTTAPPAARPDDCPPAAAPDPPSGEQVELIEVGTFDGGKVLAGEYPVPDELGDPWSQWGEGVALPDGRFVSAVGDHRGRDGRSWFYEYDPGTRLLTRTAEVGPALGHRAGDWGYGKIHAPMVLDACDRVVTATYWGSRRDLELGGSYQGDHVVRYDPSARSIESLGVPAPGYGIPSLSITPDRSRLYVEAVDPASDPDAGRFLAVDALTGEVLATSDQPDHVGFRDVLVTADGTGLFAAGDGDLAGLDLAGEAVREPDGWSDGWLRSATDPAADGTVGFVTTAPDALFRRDADGTVTALGPLEGYVASLALAPDGRTAYYVPGAHGDGWREGTPLVAVDLATGARTELVRLNDLIEPALGVGVGGSYDVVVDPGGRRIFVGLNGGPDLEDSAFGHVVLAVVELDGEPAGTASATSAAVDAIACRSVRPAELESSGRDGIAFVDATVDRGLLDPLTGMYGHAVAAGDVDSDGWLDLFVGGFADRPSGDYAVRGADGPSPDQLLLGGPDGFRPDPTFPGERARTSGATLADLDGDGDLDLVAVRNPRSGGPVTAAPTTIFENTAEGWERSTELASDVSARAAAALDVDGDGRLDLLVAGDRFGTSGTRAYRNEGGLSFVDASAAWGVPEDLTGLAMATVDLDGDGWRDVVVNGDERVLRGGPDGFTVEREADLTWELLGDEDDPAGVAVGDLDGDGRPDLVLGQHFNSTIDDGARVPVRILLNRSVARGGLELVDVTATAGSPGLWTKSPHVAVADIDADGRPDIVTSAVTASGAPLVLRNLGRRDGVPRFQPVGEPGSGAYYVTGVTADLDLDGRVDLFQVAWEPDRASTLFRNVSDVGSSIRVDLAALADPAGSVVRVTTGDGTVRTAWAASTTGYAAGAPAVVEIGVGPAGSDDAADRLRAEISPPGRPPLVLDPCT